jgi:ATP-dependent protease HslVU (ClpYQ) peptidase subunit
MTCIVGLLENGNIYMGGDSAGVGGYSLSTRKDEKVFINGEFIFGFTTSFRMGQLLRYSLDPPERYPKIDVYKFMVNDFINAVRKCLKDGGYAQKDKEEELGGTFLVGYQGRLFEIEDDYQVAEVFENYASCGCGFDLALGSLFSTEGQEPEKRVRMALEAAAKFSAGVSPPFNIKILSGREELTNA